MTKLKKECPSCECTFRPFYVEQVYCSKCRDGANEYDRDCGEMNFKG